MLSAVFWAAAATEARVQGPIELLKGACSFALDALVNFLVWPAEMVRPNIPDTGKRSAEHGIASLAVWIMIPKVQLERTRLEDWAAPFDRVFSCVCACVCRARLPAQNAGKA